MYAEQTNKNIFINTSRAITSGNWNKFKNGEKPFLLHLKSSFRFSDIETLALHFLVMQKFDLLKKLTLFPKFLKSQSGKLIITI